MKELNQRLVPVAISRLRAEIEALPVDNGGKRKGVPKDLKQRVAEALTASGMPMAEFAAAVSVSVSAVTCWRKDLGSRRKKTARKGGFKKMTVVEEPSAVAGSFTIEGPSGIRMTGLGAEDVARLWRALC